MTNRILRLPSVKEITGLSRSTLYAQIAEGRFPAPILLGGRAVGWIEAEVHAWVEDRIRAARVNENPMPHELTRRKNQS